MAAILKYSVYIDKFLEDLDFYSGLHSLQHTFPLRGVDILGGRGGKDGRVVGGGKGVHLQNVVNRADCYR